jgi:SNF2 family DNA or RNA helicase
MENSPFQAFSQFEILQRGALGHTTFGGTPKKSAASRHPCPTCGPHCRGFKNEFATWFMGWRGPELDEYQNLDILKERMSRFASVVLRSDCEDLPPLQYDHRTIEMESEQKQWWDAVKNQVLEDIEKFGQEQVFDGGAALVKLQQVEGGFWLNRDKTVKQIIPIKRNPKIIVLFDEIEWHNGQVIVWFEYLHEIDAAQKFLAGAGIKCGVFSGRERNRDRHLAAFKAGDVPVLLAQPRAGGEGRDMSVADKIIWFSQTPDAVVRMQANERATRMGTKSVQIIDLMTPVGEYFLKITSRKSTLANDVARYGLREVISNLERR